MKTIVADIKNIAWLCKPFWKYGRVYMLLSLFILVIPSPIDDILYVFSPMLILTLLTRGQAFATIAVVVIALAAIGGFKNILPNLFLVYFRKKRTQIELKIRRDIYQEALSKDYKHIDNPKYYDNYTWAVNEYVRQTSGARDFAVNFFRNLTSILLLLSVIATIGPWILFVEAVQLLLHAIINLRQNKVELRRRDEDLPMERRFAYIHRLFYMRDYAADLKTTSLGKYVFDIYGTQESARVDIVTRYAKKTLWFGVLHELIFCATEIIVILNIVHNIIVGNIPEVGLYMTVLLAFYRVDAKLQGFFGMMKEANMLSLSANRIRDFFNIESEIENTTGKPGMAPPDGMFSVALKDVCFSYENSAFSISNFSLEINPGEKVAIVGENGVGKSTFVKLLLRLYDVESGDILINGSPLREYDIHLLRKKIGVAFQNTNVYAMSYAQNVALYDPLQGQALQSITNQLELSDILAKNNATYETELTREFTESGIVLSGGEAQKIALARVMSGDFGLIILDEPSSALDPIAEHKMSELILGAANRTTTIMIAHRLSTIRNADKIVLVDQGTVKELGTHDELMALKGKYHEMFTKQAENYLR